MRGFHLFSLLIFAVTASFGQLIDKPNIELISVVDGLPSSNTTALLQDRRGFIWIGSLDGLIRYDGYSFLHITAKPEDKNSLPNNSVYSIIEDQNGFIWLGQLGGYVSRIDPNTLEVKKIQLKEALETDINKLFMDSQGKIWLSVRSVGLFRYDGKESFEFVSELPELPQLNDVASKWFNAIGCFVETNDRKIWLGTVNGLHQLDIKTNTIRKISDFRQLNDRYPSTIQTMTVIDTAYLWCGTYGAGLIRYHIKTKTWKQFLFQSGPSGTNNIVNTVLPKDEDELWLTASGKGIGTFNIKTEKFTFYYEPDDFDTGPIAQSLIKDRSGILWYASDKGLHKWSEQQNKFLFTKILTRKSDNAAYYGLSDILVDQKTGRTILGTTFTEGLTIVDRTGKVTVLDFKVLPHAEPYHIVTDLMQDSQGTIWVLTRDALYSLTDDNRLVLESSLLKNFDATQIPFLVRIMESRKGDLWVCSSRHGVFRKRRSSTEWQSFTADNFAKLVSNRVTRVMEDQQENIWMAHPVDGVTRYSEKDGTFINYRKNQSDSTSLASNRVTDITMDSKGKVWISTVEGISVFELQTNNFRNITSKSGLRSDLVFSICADVDDNIWLHNSLGITAIRAANGSFAHYNFMDGLKGAYGSFMIRNGEEGKMYAITYQGFYTFYPRKILWGSNKVSPMVITGIRNNNEVISNAGGNDQLKIDFEKNSVSLEFAALNYLNPHQNRYVYMMEGLDKQWTETSDHVVNYAGLPSGSYLFRVKQKNVFDKENEAQLRIMVTTPFWKQRWFLALWLSFLAASGYYLYKLRMKKIREEEKIKSDFKQKLAEVEMKALRAQMSPHFIFNSLNSINRYIVKSEPDTASLYLTKFSKLIRLILDNSNHKIISLEQEITAIRLYIQLESLRFSQKFSYTLAIAPELNPISIGVPPMIIQPFVENAIWHGLLHKETPGHLDIRIERYGHGLQCIVQDDGIGRARAKELKSKSITEEKSYGMKITADRLSMLNGDSTVDSIKIEDLKDENGKPAGTKVIVRIMTAELEPEF